MVVYALLAVVVCAVFGMAGTHQPAKSARSALVLLGCSLAAAAIGIAAAAVSLYILSGSSTFVGAQAFSDWSIHDIALLAAMVLGAIVAVCALFMASYAIGKRIGWAREEREAKTRNAACPASGLDSRKKEF